MAIRDAINKLKAMPKELLLYNTKHIELYENALVEFGFVRRDDYDFGENALRKWEEFIRGM